MKKAQITLFFILLTCVSNAQSIFGKWENKNEETNQVDSVIEVYEENGKAFAKIIEIKNKNRQNAGCDKCKGKQKDKPILGMVILSGLKKDGDEWSGGKILDPKNGKEYKCSITLKDNNTMELRGYIGFSLLGRTAYWYRKNG